MIGQNGELLGHATLSRLILCSFNHAHTVSMQTPIVLQTQCTRLHVCNPFTIQQVPNITCWHFHFCHKGRSHFRDFSVHRTDSWRTVDTYHFSHVVSRCLLISEWSCHGHQFVGIEGLEGSHLCSSGLPPALQGHTGREQAVQLF